jgi:hypothetical protein
MESKEVKERGKKINKQVGKNKTKNQPSNVSMI